MAASYLIRARCERNRTPGDLLCEALEDLEQYDFKRFKDKLSDFMYGGRGPIPRGRLEMSDCVTTKNLIIDVYGAETALTVAIEVFILIKLRGPAGDLQNSVTQHVESQRMFSNLTLEDCRLRYMGRMREKYHVIKDHDNRLGEDFNLKKGFTRLLLIKNFRDEGERHHEITSSGQRHLQIMEDRSSDEYSPTTIQALFDPGDGGIVPKTVVLQGPAGIGKTMTSQKIMLDWASGDLYKDKFQFVFYISCREVNTITGNISLAGYVSKYCCLPKCPPELLQSIFTKAEGVLFVVDGLDELKWSSVNDTEVCDDPFQVVSKEILLNSLFKKALLWERSLIITTRPFSLKKLKDSVECTRTVEILGFTGKDREEYFYNFFETKEQADLALSTVKDNDTLFTMCVVPITCWIICTVMKPLLKKGLSVIDSKTCTSIYLLYLKGLIKYHGRDSAQPISRCIKKLCALANEGVWDQSILFEEWDLVRHGLSVSEVESVFLNENIFHRDVETRTCYSFIHLSVQEFFAALYYVLYDTSVKQPFLNFLIRNVRNLLKASEDKPHLKLTVRFLFGLSSEKQIQETQKTIGCPVSFREKPELEEWLKRHPSYYHNEVLCCLYETQDDCYVERMMSHFLNVKIKGRLDSLKSDPENIACQAVAYCLERSTIKHTVTFDSYILGPKARRVLSKALSKCPELRFMNCSFPVIEEEGYLPASSLSGLFKDCQVKELILCDCTLTLPCCDDLRTVIAESRSLVRLSLLLNNLQDSGIRLLCEGLRHPACRLQRLWLQRCGLTSSCCEALSSVITHRCLTTLDLSGNDLQDHGVKLLCEGLRHPACTLQDLTLQYCGLTTSCGNDLRSVLTANRSLIRLDLTMNMLEDRGVKHLCKGLNNPDCALKELMLHCCDLTSSCCDDLCSVFNTNRSLTRLDLTGNDLEDYGVILQRHVRPPLQLRL